MCTEFFSVRDDGRGKYIDYHGFAWARDNDDGERGVDGELLDWAFTYGKVGPVYLSDVAGDPFDAVMERFEACQQYQDDMGEDEHRLLLEGFYGGRRGERMHMSDVGEHAPCGDYFFENGEDEPLTRRIPSKEYALRVSDLVDGALEELLGDLVEDLERMGYVQDAPPRAECDDAYFEGACNLRDAVIRELERLGLRVRPDGAHF